MFRTDAPTAQSREPSPRASGGVPRKRKVSAFWLRQFHTWHWMSSAICLVGMLLFAATGITLNHAGSIESEPAVESMDAQLPASVLRSIAAVPDGAVGPVPGSVTDWLRSNLDVDVSGRVPEWSGEELYIPLPRAGGDGWVAIDRTTGMVTVERTDRGWIAFLNDLHKGRDTGTAWAWFIDIFAVACVVFCLTGFLLLQLHAKKRRSTWPIVAAGVVVPTFLILFLMH